MQRHRRRSPEIRRHDRRVHRCLRHGPVGLAFEPGGDLFVSSAISGHVKVYDGLTGAYQQDLVSIANPTDLLFHPNGNLLVASAVLNVVNEYNPATGQLIQTFASGNGLSIPIGMILGPDGHLYVASSGTDSVKRFDGLAGAYIDDFVAAGSGGLDGTHFFAFLPTPSPAQPRWATPLVAPLLIAIAGMILKRQTARPAA